MSGGFESGGFMVPDELRAKMFAAALGKLRPLTHRERLRMWVDGVRERIALVIAPWLR